MTPAQIKLLHAAKRDVGLDEGRYRVLLRTVAGVESGRDLDNVGFEDVMGVIESMGLSERYSKGGNYWRGKVERRSKFANERMLHKIEALSAEAGYEVCGFCRRMTRGRTDDLAELDPREAWVIIEALKVIVERQQEHYAEIESEKDLPSDPSIPF